MKNVALLTILLLAAPIVGQPAPADKPTERREPTPYAALDREPRLKKHITLEKPPENVGKLLKVIGEKTGVTIICQGDFLKAPPVLVQASEPVEARELLTQIALVARGVWIRRNGIYRLMENGIDVYMFQIGGSTARAQDAAQRLAALLTPAQREWLSSRPIAFQRLSQEQQYLFTLAFNNEYRSRPELFLKGEFVTQEKCQVRVVPTENGGAQLWLMAPIITVDNGEGYGPFLIQDLRPK